MTQFWYALHTKPRMEEFLSDQIRSRGMEVFSPSIRVQPVNPRARKQKPYFPGYIFVHSIQENNAFSAYRYLPGSAGLVQFDGEPAFIPDGLIHAIQLKVQAINAAGGELFTSLKKGEDVLIHSGPFAGYEAIFDARLPGNERVRVLLKLLKNHQLPVDLPAGLIRQKNNRPMIFR